MVNCFFLIKSLTYSFLRAHLITFYLGIALVQCLPIIGLDLWEHAYFSAYDGDKEAYVDRFWDFIDWEKVSADFESHLLANYKLAPLL